MNTPTLQAIEARLESYERWLKAANVPCDFDLLNDLRTLLALCKQSQAWVAIETEQPKIRTEVLIVEASGISVALYERKTGRGYAFTISEYPNIYFYPKHWHPLPPLPSLNKGEDE